MPTDANIVAEPSAATEKVQYDNWDETGKPIVSKTPEAQPKQDSAPASSTEKKSESEPSGKTAAESEAAPKQEKKGKATAEERIAELVAEREAERRERKALEERLRKLESSPQTTPKAEAKAEEPPKRPNPFKWTGTPEEFEAAQEKWEQHQAQKAVSDFQQTQAKQAAENKWLQTVNDYRQKYADFDSKVEPVSKTLSELPDLVKAWFPRSENAMDVLYMLSGSQELMDKLVAVAKSDPYDAINKLAEMKRDVVAAMKKEPKAEPEPKTESKEPPAEPKPRAPKPPSEVGGRGTAPADESLEAARSGNFRDFEAAERRKLQARYAKA